MTLENFVYLIIGVLIGAEMVCLYFYKEYRSMVKKLDKLEAKHSKNKEGV